MNMKFKIHCIKKGSLYSGYSLIEVMISLVLGLLVTTGIFQIYISNKQTYRLAEGQSRLQENARFALNFLSEDIRMAGYMGCISRATPPNIILNTPTDHLYNFVNPLEGFEWVGPGAGPNAWSVGGAGSPPAAWAPAAHASILSPLDNSDIITIRRTEITGNPVVNHPNGAANVTLANAGTPALENCDLVVISSCTAATLFQISTFPDPAVAPFIATHAGGACVPLGNPGSPLAAPGNAVDPVSLTTNLMQSFANGQLYRYQNISYFIRHVPDPVDPLNAIPTLFRRINMQNSTALVEGIEQMQVFYGADTNADGNADRYYTANQFVAPPAVPLWNQVVSVRISLLVSSIEANLVRQPAAINFNGIPVNVADGRLRRQFTTTIAIRNSLQ